MNIIRPTIKRPEKEIQELVNKLHDEKKKKEMEREKLTDEYFKEFYPFSPFISDKNAPNAYKFLNRLQDWIEKRNNKIKQDIINSFYDTKTGQKLYSPTKSEASKECIAHRKEVNLFEYLHEDKFIREKNRDLLEINATNEAKEISNTKLLTENSEKINILLKEDCFMCLFNTFDYNGDDLIECTDSFMKNIDDKLDKNLLEIFNPIFLDLKDNEETLSKEEFFLAMEELFKLLTVTQKRNLIDWYINQKRVTTNERRKSILVNKELSFSPKISENSNFFYSCSKRYSKVFLERNIDHNINKENYFRIKSNEKYEKEIEGKIKDERNKFYYFFISF
jgi:hypothetical protein